MIKKVSGHSQITNISEITGSLVQLAHDHSLHEMEGMFRKELHRLGIFCFKCGDLSEHSLCQKCIRESLTTAKREEK